MSAAAHSICPDYNRCNKYLEFTLKLDAYEERDRRKNAVIAAQAKRIAELEAMLNGYAWGFFTDDLSIYRFRESRGSKVALDVFGEGQHRGGLVVDRYAGYNPAATPHFTNRLPKSQNLSHMLSKLW